MNKYVTLLEYANEAYTFYVTAHNSNETYLEGLYEGKVISYLQSLITILNEYVPLITSMAMDFLMNHVINDHSWTNALESLTKLED